MMKALVAYFSAEAGTTRRIAEEFADTFAADQYEIKPEKPYSEADLKWTNPLARCNRGKLGKKDVPVEGKEPGWAEYDTVYLGFPIWYYAAPNVIQTFCKDHGANNIRLSTKETNTYALSMYRKAGFHDTGEMNDVEIVLQIDL